MDIEKEIKEMKKAVIEYVKSGTYNKEKTDNVINFLQQGWKYEGMWRELYEQFIPYNSTQKISLEVSNRLNWDDLMKYLMNKIKQKHFSKVAK